MPSKSTHWWRKLYGSRLRGLRVEAGKKSVGDWFAYGTLEVNDATSGEPVSANALTDEVRWQNTVGSNEHKFASAPPVTFGTVAAAFPLPKKPSSETAAASKPLSVQTKAKLSRRREINSRPADQSGAKA